MLLEIKSLINEAQIQKIQEVLTGTNFVDGRSTAGRAAAQKLVRIQDYA